MAGTPDPAPPLSSIRFAYGWGLLWTSALVVVLVVIVRVTPRTAEWLAGALIGVPVGTVLGTHWLPRMAPALRKRRLKQLMGGAVTLWVVAQQPQFFLLIPYLYVPGTAFVAAVGVCTAAAMVQYLYSGPNDRVRHLIASVYFGFWITLVYAETIYENQGWAAVFDQLESLVHYFLLCSLMLAPLGIAAVPPRNRIAGDPHSPDLKEGPEIRPVRNPGFPLKDLLVLVALQIACLIALEGRVPRVPNPSSLMKMLRQGDVMARESGRGKPSSRRAATEAMMVEMRETLQPLLEKFPELPEVVPNVETSTIGFQTLDLTRSRTFGLDGAVYYGLRFKMPAKGGSLFWSFSYGLVEGWYIVPRKPLGMVGFTHHEGFYLKNGVPGSDRYFLMQSLPASSLIPGEEYVIWFTPFSDFKQFKVSLSLNILDRPPDRTGSLQIFSRYFAPDRR